MTARCCGVTRSCNLSDRVSPMLLLYSAWQYIDEGCSWTRSNSKFHRWFLVIGCCGLHARIGTGALEIGYWVRIGYLQRGVATAAAGALTDAALALSEVDRVEIRCGVANSRSASIPPKLGYRMDRIQHRPPTTPGETDQHMIWVLDRS